ncbi:MAG: carboxymuconolactone decarboxylase family protein [Akkermansiaceae bacterium]|nr:carboxymuconolactone decarboxylase family protein [Akkermansiaceae bacterium]NNM29688.1 carboxymuconolactone decarboxylase family protein [Akkermansiaceae bacterium]
MKLEVHSARTAPEGSRSVLEATEKKIGFVPNLLGVLAESPAALQAYSNLSSALQHNADLSASEQQVVFLAISFQNKCAYCMAAHSTIAGNGILTNSQIEALRRGAPLDDEKLEALRRFTLQVVETRGWPPEAELERFLDAGYKKRHVLDLLAAIALKTLTNYTNHISETEVDEAFAPQAWQES